MESFKGFRKWFLKKTKIGLSFGWGMQFFKLLPKQRPLYIVVGKPIPVEAKVPNPSEEQIDQLHQLYETAMAKLFEENKGKYGFEDRKLEIY